MWNPGRLTIIRPTVSPRRTPRPCRPAASAATRSIVSLNVRDGRSSGVRSAVWSGRLAAVSISASHIVRASSAAGRAGVETAVVLMSRRLVAGLVLERDPEPDPELLHLPVLDRDVLADHLGHTQVAHGLRCRRDGIAGGIGPRFGAGPDHLGDPVDAAGHLDSLLGWVCQADSCRTRLSESASETASMSPTG